MHDNYTCIGLYTTMQTLHYGKDYSSFQLIIRKCSNWSNACRILEIAGNMHSVCGKPLSILYQCNSLLLSLVVIIMNRQ